MQMHMQNVLKSVGDMAMMITAAMKSPHAEKESPANTTNTKSGSPSAKSVGISPGRRIDLHDKLLRHDFYGHDTCNVEQGAIIVEQFEKRSECTMKQLEQFD